MYIRFMSLAAALTTSVAYAAFMSPDRPLSPSTSSTSSIVATLPAAIHPMVRLSDEYMTPAHAAARIPWPKGILPWLDAGECAMIVQTNIEPNQNDIYDLLTVPQLMVNGMPEELTNFERWSSDLGGSDVTRCKAILAGMIAQMNRQLVVKGSSRGYVLKNENQKIIAFAIALAYKGSAYRAQAKWDEKADQLIPFLSVDHIHEDTVPVAVRIDSITKTPVAERALSGL